MSDQAYYEPHQDVMWFDEAVEVTPRAVAKPRKLIGAEDPDTGVEPQPRASKALPGTMIDGSFGVCVCWLCSDIRVPKHEVDWIFNILAKYALGKPQPDQGIWIQDWTMRHGKFAGAVLQRHIDWNISIYGANGT